MNEGKPLIEVLTERLPEILAIIRGNQLIDSNVYRVQLRDDHGSEAVIIVRADGTKGAKKAAMDWASGYGTTWKVASTRPL